MACETIEHLKQAIEEMLEEKESAKRIFDDWSFKYDDIKPLMRKIETELGVTIYNHSKERLMLKPKNGDMMIYTIHMEDHKVYAILIHSYK
jgi:hypothetical protein